MRKPYTIKEVKTRSDRKQFLELSWRMYRDDPNYIRPLDQDVEKVFDPQKNKNLKHGECIRWLLYNEEGQAVGKVAAFYDSRVLRKDPRKAGGMGFFDCINDQEAANYLFDACKTWLQSRGAMAMDGPVNFGDRNSWWGCLVDGFHEPAYCMHYNYPYYAGLFEGYGFQVYYKQFTYHRRLDSGGLDEVIYEKAMRIERSGEYSFRHVEKKRLLDYARDYTEIYNRAWAKFPGIQKVTPSQARIVMKQLKPVIDERLMWFAYHQDQPVGLFLMIPEINQIIRHLNGKMNFINKLRFAWYLRRGTCTGAHGLLFGIVPEHQGKGLEGALIIEFVRVIQAGRFPYKDLEMNWIGDFNPKMMHLVERIGGRIRKTHVTFRYLFDSSMPFERMPKV